MTMMDRQEWLKLRKNYIGASDAPVIMNGLHFQKTPYKLWQEKLGLSGPQYDNSAMRYGRETEEIARQSYEKYTGEIMTPRMVFHPKKNFMMATLDGLNFNGDVAVEIKCPGIHDHRTAQEGKVPSKYYPQLQHQLACININQLHYFSFRDGEGVLVEVQRDDAYIESLYQKEGSFWEKVLNLSAPDLTERDYEEKDTPEWERIARRWAKRQTILKSLESEDKEDRVLLIKLAGNSNATGHGIRVSKIVRKGNVNYKSIPELKGVDLDKYRKSAIESWRLEEIA